MRKGKRKKQAFRGAVRSYGERLGYVYAEEKGALGARNVLFGNPEKADYLVTAHYDTCARLPFPNFITPCNVGIYLLYQIVVALLFCVPVLGAVWLAACLTESPLAMLLTGYGCLILLVWLLLCGPANRHNANDNTSGVAALLRTAEQLTPRYRNDVCFLFLDGGSDNMRGAKGFRKRYPSAKEKPVLCLDCVGSGDELLILPGKGARWNGELLDAINSSFENSERKTCYDKVDGLVHFPGDQRAFKQGVAVCAVRRVPGFGRFICPTGKDNRIDDENLELLSRGLVKLAAAYQIKK